MSIPAEWGGCDAAGIVFFPSCFRWFDAAARNLFEVAGGGWDRIRQRVGKVNMPLLAADRHFPSPLRPADRLAVESRVVARERKVFRIQHRVLNDDRVAAEGTETRCWAAPDPADPSRLRGIPIPDELIDLFSGSRLT
jgi:4-hydroxybenzoyl-CoA thioesterase